MMHYISSTTAPSAQGIEAFVVFGKPVPVGIVSPASSRWPVLLSVPPILLVVSTEPRWHQFGAAVMVAGAQGAGRH